MTQVGGAFVRLRPALDPRDREALEALERDARALADGLASFLSHFAPEPENVIARALAEPAPTNGGLCRPAFEESHD